MGKIYIVEDDRLFAERVKKSVEAFFWGDNKHSYFSGIETISSDYLEWMTFDASKDITALNLYILDVEINGEILGFKIAQKIRKVDPFGFIIFLTSHIELMSDAFMYNLKALNYIHKNDSSFEEKLKKSFEQVLVDYGYLKDMTEEKSSVLSYKYKGILYRIAYDEIKRIETNTLRRELSIITDMKVYPCGEKLRAIEEILPDYFVKIHRSIIVNSKLIKQIVKKESGYVAVFLDNEEVYISRNYVAKAKNIIL